MPTPESRAQGAFASPRGALHAHRTGSLFRFLARAGLRVALREQIPALALALGLASLLGGDFLLSLATALFPEESAFGAHGWLLALLFLSTASLAARRVQGGRDGALRSLPATGDHWRRAIWLADVVALLPLMAVAAVLLAIAGGLLVVGHPDHPFAPLSAGRGIESALSLLLFGPSSAALTTTRFAGSPRAASLALGSWVSAAVGFSAGLVLAIVLLVAWDRLPSRVGRRRPPVRHPRSRPFFAVRPRPSAAWIGVAIVARALGFRVLGPWLLGSLALGAGALFIANNDLPDRYATGAERLAALSALAFSAAFLVDLLARRTAPWPWARSLPWSARRRVRLEAIQIAVALSPVLVLSLVWAPRGGLAALGVLPFVALRAATQLHLVSRLSPGLRTAFEALLVAGVCALLPLVSLLALALVPWWLRLAAEADRGQAPSAWQELAYHAEGDPVLKS